jgi:predicted MFS family arabinose efflux permease
MNASLFSMLLYLVLYLQDVQGFSALDTGLRLLVLSGGTLSTSTVAGKLTSRVPIRLLIGPGLLLVGIGLFLMGGLHATTPWTHLIPGFIVAGVGTGLVNPPLASTAVGVVEPRRSGMASGINTTFRQVGIATSIAALGSRPRSGRAMSTPPSGWCRAATAPTCCTPPPSASPTASTTSSS